MKSNKNKNQRVMEFSKSAKKDLLELNRGREMNGLEIIKIKVKPCNSCDQLFESTGNINCGCNKPLRLTTAIYQCRECI